MSANKLIIFTAVLLFACGTSADNLADWLNEPKWGPSPSEFAKNCTDFKHENLVDYCEKHMEKSYSTVGMNSPFFPTWQLTCATFNIFNCYMLNAKHYCSTQQEAEFVSSYSHKFGDFLERSIAGTVRFIGGQPSCGKDTHDAVAAYYNKTVEEQGFKSVFVHLPVADGPARACLSKLAGHGSASKDVHAVDHEAVCISKALDRFDVHRRKLFESAISDACCALYSALDCLEEAAVGSVCTPVEHTAFSVYRAKAIIAYGNSVCKSIPYNLAGSICAHK